MKNIVGICTVLLLSFNSYASSEHFSEYIEQADHKIQSTGTVKVGLSSSLSIEVFTRNFRKSDKMKLAAAIEILRDVMNSKEFKHEVLNFTYQGKTQFNQNNDMTNQEIYEHLMTGAEVLNPVVDHVMNFDLTMYRSLNPFSKVKGYTKPDTNRIWIHSKFYRRRSWTPIDVAANMAHEWVHKMGFGHDYYYDENRPYSVPYGIGGIVTKVAKQLGY